MATKVAESEKVLHHSRSISGTLTGEAQSTASRHVSTHTGTAELSVKFENTTTCVRHQKVIRVFLVFVKFYYWVLDILNLIQRITETFFSVICTGSNPIRYLTDF